MNKKVNKHTIGEVELELIPMPLLIYSHWEGIQRQDEPQVPVIEANLAGGKKGIIYNSKDEDYKALTAKFEANLNLKSIEFIISYCVLTEPPVEYVVPEGLGSNDHKNRKLVWVLSMLGDAEEINRFTQMCLGQGIPDEKEVAEETATFQSNGQRGEHLALPVSQQETPA